MKTFEVGEKVLWWNGYSMIESVIEKSSKYSCLIVSDEAKKAYEALVCDLYRKTPEDLARLKSRINDLRYHCTNLMEELDLMIEEKEGTE